MNGCAAPATLAHCGDHVMKHQFAMDGRPGGPPHDLAREQVEDHGEVEPALPRPDVRNVGRPCDVGSGDRELSREQIGDQHGWLANQPTPSTVAVQRAHPTHSHWPRHALLAARLARFPQVEEHSRRAVHTLTRRVRCADEAKELIVLDRPGRLRPLEPIVIAAGSNPEDAARHLRRELLTMVLDEGILRADTSCLDGRGNGPLLVLVLDARSLDQRLGTPRLHVWSMDNHSILIQMMFLLGTVSKVGRRSDIAAAGSATMPKFEGTRPAQAERAS
jgi:hypothetical protein